jgi:hypothetical protein
MKVVFLDFDGVVNSRETRKRYPDKYTDIDPYHVQFLNKITDATGAVIVITSSWRFSPDAVDHLVGAGATAPIAGKIPDSTNRGRNGHYATARCGEIKTWMSENNITQFVILDDIPTEYTFDRENGKETVYYFEGLEDHHVHCADRGGLLEKHVEMAVNIIEKQAADDSEIAR